MLQFDVTGSLDRARTSRGAQAPAARPGGIGRASYSRSSSARSSDSFSRRSSSRSPRSTRVEQVAHERRELDRVERLRHVVDAAEVDAARTVAQLGARGEEDDRDRFGARRRRAAPRRPASRRAPASSRRAGSRRAARRAPSRARSGRRRPRAPSIPSASRLTRQRSRIGASSSITRTRVRHSARVIPPSSKLTPLLRRDRQLEREPRPASFLRVDPDPAAHLSDEALRDEEAEARARARRPLCRTSRRSARARTAAMPTPSSATATSTASVAPVRRDGDDAAVAAST